ncbi:MAG TPA: TolC family protein [Gemmatimonadaceae bacterium]|nr:TolC family protein [Gemmatimonadaceae bacterium]
MTPRVVATLVAVLMASAPRAAAQQTLTLQDAIALAQRQGLAAQAASSARDAERWRNRAFNARRLPQLSLEGTVPSINRGISPVFRPDGTTAFVTQREMESSVALTLSQAVPATGGEIFVSSGLTRLDRYGEEDSRLWQSTPVVFGIRQQLFRSNTLKWDEREQDARAEVAEQRYLESREEVALATANAFFDVYGAELTLANAAANAAINDTLHLLNTGRYEVGKIGENDLLQSELAVLRARTSLDGARLERDRAMAELKRLTSLPPDVTLAIVVPASAPDVQADTTVAVAQALRNRSQMRSLELEDIVARRQVSQARLNTGFGMSVSASAGFNQTAPVFDDAYRSLLDRQRLTVEVAMPLVQWGGRRAEIQAARAEQDRVGALARETRASVEQDARFAALALPLARRQLATSAKADTVAAKRFDVAKNRYIIGRIDIGDLYIAQSEKDAALLSYVEALRNYWLAYYRLRRLTLYDFEAGRPLAP